VNKFLTALVTVIALASSVQAADIKIGFVDIAYVMAKSPQRVAIAEKLKNEFKEQEEEIKSLYEEYKKLQEKAQKDGATMSEKERLELQREGQEMETKLKLKQQALNEDSQRRANEEQRQLGAKILEKVAELAKEEKYTMIINKDALLWADQATNVSDKVLAKLSASN
jgi:outer membrane protein